MEPSLRTRLRWQLEELRHLDDRKVIAGLLLVAALTFGGFLAARTVARASASPGTRFVTVRQRVRVREHGHVVTRWRLRRLAPQAQTVLRTQTVDTPSGVRVVTRPVNRYQVVNQRHVVTVAGQPRTVTRQVTVTRVATVTRRVTVMETTTAVSTKTEPLPITVTVPLP
jgi:hypothetical protein